MPLHVTHLSHCRRIVAAERRKNEEGASIVDMPEGAGSVRRILEQGPVDVVGSEGRIFQDMIG